NERQGGLRRGPEHVHLIRSHDAHGRNEVVRLLLSGRFDPDQIPHTDPTQRTEKSVAMRCENGISAISGQRRPGHMTRAALQHILIRAFKDHRGKIQPRDFQLPHNVSHAWSGSRKAKALQLSNALGLTPCRFPLNSRPIAPEEESGKAKEALCDSPHWASRGIVQASCRCARTDANKKACGLKSSLA